MQFFKVPSRFPLHLSNFPGPVGMLFTAGSIPSKCHVRNRVQGIPRSGQQWQQPRLPRGPSKHFDIHRITCSAVSFCRRPKDLTPSDRQEVLNTRCKSYLTALIPQLLPTRTRMSVLSRHFSRAIPSGARSCRLTNVVKCLAVGVAPRTATLAWARSTIRKNPTHSCTGMLPALSLLNSIIDEG